MNPALRKRIGQFFTGDRLSLLLAELAGARGCSTIVDPMAGSGDMLVASLRAGAQPTVLAGIEIDPTAVQSAQERLRDIATARVSVGNAFDLHAWDGLPREWDLVITNPPYVRYQSASRSVGGVAGIPDAREVRHGLISLLRGAPSDGEAAAAFVAAAQDYSGLADLAVPSWILVASRVRVGGRLAVVVPNTWLTRDYASSVQKLLGQFFVIEYVVEDRDASWFNEALVRTSLVVGRRVREARTETTSRGYLRIEIGRAASNDSSLVGKAFPRSRNAESAFAKWAKQLRRTGTSGERPGIRAVWSNGADLGREWKTADPVGRNGPMHVPDLVGEVTHHAGRLELSIGALGWDVGQGLRTGANDFFYVHMGDDSRCRSPLVADRDLELPAEVLLPSIRRQGDLMSRGRRVLESRSKLLWLGEWALEEDARRYFGPRDWRIMTDDLDLLVRAAAVTPHYPSGGLLPSLSAVRTNVRAPRTLSEMARFWYHLPKLMSRHRPDILIARVNGATPSPWLNPARKFVIDANFSSLWRRTDEGVSPLCMLAVLSSVWTRALFEAMGTVMGGGALKLEASHLRRLPLPRLTGESLNGLEKLGAEIADRGEIDEVLRMIDHVLLSNVWEGDPEPRRRELVALVDRLRDARTGSRNATS